MATPQRHDEATEDTREFAFSREAFDFIARLTYERTGIVLNANKYDMVYSRLVRRVRALGLPDFSAYCEMLRGEEGDREMGPLVNAITTNLTHFFREPHHFESLREYVAALPTRERRLRVWSAGCSSGMEPYSIAMTLLNCLPDIASRDVKILATDIDSGMLEKAIKGHYPSDEYENIPAACRHYVDCAGESMVVGDAPRALIRFNELNLLGDWPMKGPFDVIYCRNVVIYFDAPTKQRLFERYTELLRPGGLLFIGHSESVPASVKGLTLLTRTTYRKDA